MQKKWYILLLIALTSTTVVAAPPISITVLFDEISHELGLSLVQIGYIWGMASLPGIFTSLLGGAIIDRLGPRRVLVGCIILMGLAGASRGFATGYLSLMLTVFLTGLLSTVTIMSMYKTIGFWFPKRQLGTAAGILSMGMALGFLLGTLLSASFLSPWLGGWRHVMFFYSLFALVLVIFWYFALHTSGSQPEQPVQAATVPIWQAIRHVAGLKNAWLLALALLGFSGSVQGTLGYLPLYLRQSGWTDLTADSAISSFHLASMVMVLPIAMLSDRLGTRKGLLLLMGLMTTTGISLLAWVQGTPVWGAVILAGMVRDGFMALFMIQVMETDQVGPRYAGTATGFVQVFSSLGNTLAPSLGNQLASISAGLPFAAWGLLAAAGLLSLLLTRPHARH
jgi:predicted MFS family arabinose efflux permease